MEPIEKLKEMIKEKGNQKDVAKELDISQAYLSDILKGNRIVSQSVAKKLGFHRQITFRAMIREDAPMANPEPVARPEPDPGGQAAV
jgi:transcriptional regulator with XRE-family HTH domain